METFENNSMVYFQHNSSWLMINVTLNSSESFDSVARGPRLLDRICDGVVGLTLIVLMLGMGCTIEIKKLLNHFRRPFGPAVGMLCQLVVLPLTAFGVCKAFKTNPYASVGLLVLASSPGGALSNLFTFWADGDVALSFTMTISSNLLAFGVMPLNIWIYSRSWTNENLKVPYMNIFLSLLTTVTPAVVGIFVRWKWERIAITITKIGSVTGGVSVIGSLILIAARFPYVFLSPWLIYMAGLCFSGAGLTFGFLVTKLFRMSYKRARTIAMETGVQNIPLALTVISLSFPFPDVPAIIALPLIASYFVLSEIFLLIIGYRLWRRFCNNKNNDKEEQYDAVPKLDPQDVGAKLDVEVKLTGDLD